MSQHIEGLSDRNDEGWSPLDRIANALETIAEKPSATGRAMGPTQVKTVLAFAEVKGLCEAVMRSPEDTCEPGEKLLAQHILTVIERIFAE